METETQRQTQKFRLRVCKKLGCKNNFRSVFTHSRHTSHKVAETRNSVSAADLEVRHFASFLGVSIFLNASSARKNRLYRVGSTTVEPTPHQDEAAQRVTKCQCPSSSQFLSGFPTAVHIMQHNSISKLVLLHHKP